jgi:hypothetical protein
LRGSNQPIAAHEGIKTMDIKWIIVTIVVLSLIGSVSWVMPTPMQRAQAKIRQLAMAKGIQVKVSKLQGPRELGEVAPESYLATSYGLARQLPARGTKLDLRSSHRVTWQVFKAAGLNTQGLPDAWCWNRGEGALNAEQLEHLAQLIKQLPTDVYALGANPMAVQAYWHERATPADLDALELVLKALLTDA